MTQTPQKLSVLIADDHEMVVEMFSLFLTASSEMTVKTAKSLDEALERIKEHGPFDVTLLDLNMPGMNGVAGLVRAIKLSAGKPVAILTSNPTPRMVDEILATGASGIVLKTTPVRSLGNAIRSCMRASITCRSSWRVIGARPPTARADGLRKRRCSSCPIWRKAARTRR